jgi:ADP-ribosyl-[dinitrogen reductase] hydrolase
MTTMRADRIAGGLWGLLVGDALGVPYEFHRPEGLPQLSEIEMVPPPGFRRAHERVPPGTWSDDGAHALCMLEALLEHGGLDLGALGGRLLAWLERGHLAVDGEVFDVGIQTRTALHALAHGVDPRAAGPLGERDNGNGSLMRVLPLALWHRGSDAELAHDAMEQSLVTHGHARARVCCAFYCLWARRLLEGALDPWAAAAAALRPQLVADSEEQETLECHIRPDAPPRGGGTGYVVDTLCSARLALAAGTYEQVVRAAIALGHDTDTTACVAGGLAGIRDGVGAIPQRWLAALRGREVVEPLLARLVGG